MHCYTATRPWCILEGRAWSSLFKSVSAVQQDSRRTRLMAKQVGLCSTGAPVTRTKSLSLLALSAQPRDLFLSLDASFYYKLQKHSGGAQIFLWPRCFNSSSQLPFWRRATYLSSPCLFLGNRDSLCGYCVLSGPHHAFVHSIWVDIFTLFFSCLHVINR